MGVIKNMLNAPKHGGSSPVVGWLQQEAFPFPSLKDTPQFTDYETNIEISKKKEEYIETATS
jgi:hypothetical protein